MSANISFTATSPFGTPAGWKIQSGESDVLYDRAAALDENGDEAASQLYNARTESSASFEAGAASGVAIPEWLGGVQNSVLVTGIDVATSATGYATCNLTGHQHAANAHASERSASHGLGSVGFGAVDFLGGTAGDAASVASSTANVTVEHDDVEDKDGAHLAGNNRNAHVSVTVVWNGVPSDVGGTGWDKVSTRTARTNTGALQTIVTAEKKLTLS